jgi:hypothetical protein
VTFGGLLLVVGGFLLGGAWSFWRADHGTKGRTAAQVVIAVVFLIAALLATVAGILRLV